MSPYPPGEPAVARLSAQVEAIGREIRDMRAGFDRRLERIERQTTLTNGRVGDLEGWRTRSEATAEADARHAAADAQRAGTHDGRRWELRMALIGAAIGIASAVITAGLLAWLTPLIPGT